MNKVTEKCYKFITDAKRISFFRKIDSLLQKSGGKVYKKTLGQLKYRLHFANVNMTLPSNVGHNTLEQLLWHYDTPVPFSAEPLVSVIVPNFNHAPYLTQRFESIYNQTYQNFEVILLDDCSTDNSREILDRYALKYPEKTRTLFNDTNSGQVFKQWNKGLAAARGELIWIAEGDGYCELDFLETMVRLFEYRSVMIAFARSVFMQDGEKIGSTEEYLHDLPNLRWDTPFFMSAHNLVQNGMAIHNVIPNVSSAMFRNIGRIPEEVEEICEHMHFCSAWIFYLSIMKGSVVGYTNQTISYYRVHAQSTSFKVQKAADYYFEFEQVSCFIAQNYRVKQDIFETVLKNLKEHCHIQNHDMGEFTVEDCYSLKRINKALQSRKPNIIMACYALKSGGGETYPIYLANELARQNMAVTLINFDLEPSEKRIIDLIHPNVPVVNICSADDIGNIFYHLGADIVHSHHATVDYAVALWINSNPHLGKHIITLHGMYEAIDKADSTRVINEILRSCYKYVYTADKNLSCFKSLQESSPEKFVKYPNGLPYMSVTPVRRDSIGIKEDDFVAVLASRGIPEKGWAEAIQALSMAQEQCTKKLHLVILGDGECRPLLEPNAPSNVHFLGTVSNLRDYFSMGDVGILPSRFKGESYPLVLIDCLMTGRPVIATDIAEVSNIIQDEHGLNAGILIPLNDWHFETQDLCEAIVSLAQNPSLYQSYKARALGAGKKCDITTVAANYVSLYKEAVSGK